MAVNRTPQEAALEAAQGSLGIYPQAIKRGDTWEYRTPWQDGWNAAVLGLLTNYTSIIDWIATLPVETVGAVRELLAADVLCLTIKGSAVTCLIPMNDVFEYACADAESAESSDLANVARIWQAHGWDGLIAWAAQRRGETPIQERLTPAYHAAAAHIRQLPSESAKHKH